MSERDTMVLRGRVGTDPTTYRGEGRQTYVRFRMVVPRSRRKDNGEWEELEARWYTIRLWGSLASNAAVSLHKGNPIVVIGRPTAQAWQDREGKVRSELAVNASAIGHDLNFGVSSFQRFASSESQGYESEQAAVPFEQLRVLQRVPQGDGSSTVTFSDAPVEATDGRLSNRLTVVTAEVEGAGSADSPADPGSGADQESLDFTAIAV